MLTGIRMRKRTLQAAFILGVIMFHGPAVIAQSDTLRSVEWRSHSVAHDPSGANYRMTEIEQLPNEFEDRMYVLIQDAATGDRLSALYVINYLDHEVAVTVTDLDTKEVATSRNPLPFKSITRDGVVAEARKDPAIRTLRIDAVTIGINGVEQTAGENDWLSPRTRDQRSTVRKAASPQFLERLERLRPLAAAESPVQQVFSHLLRYLLSGTACTAQTGLQTESAEPDCEFDASFHFPCSQKAKDRITAAKKKGEKIERY